MKYPIILFDYLLLSLKYIIWEIKMKKLSISIHAFESILESLVKLEEERDLILEYYVDPNDRARISQH